MEASKLMNNYTLISNRIQARYFNGNEPRADLMPDDMQRAAEDVRAFVEAFNEEVIAPFVDVATCVVAALADWCHEFEAAYPELYAEIMARGERAQR